MVWYGMYVPGVLVLDRALRIPSGVMSTRDRMLAKAGLGGIALEAADWAVGVVGVPGDGRGDGVAADRQEDRKVEQKVLQTIHSFIHSFVHYTTSITPCGGTLKC